MALSNALPRIRTWQVRHQDAMYKGMIKLHRTTEYGLVALRHLAHKAGHSSAREIADSYKLPFEITAKTLQRLKDHGLVQSGQGSKGGYILARPLNSVTLGQFLEWMEGPQGVVGCQVMPLGAMQAACQCEYSVRCEIRPFMDQLNTRVHDFLNSIRLGDFAEFQSQSLIEEVVNV